MNAEATSTTPQDVTMDTAPQSKYPALSPTFFRGQLPGQIRSVHKDRESKAAKVKDFKQAIADGEIKLSADSLTTDLIKKLTDLGIEVDAATVEAVKAKNARAPKAEGAAADAS